MRCKFLEHGMAIKYSNIAIPCCVFKPDNNWISQNNIHEIDISEWHNSPQMAELRDILSGGVFPKSCDSCEKFEALGRGDSNRLSGEKNYADYSDSDITLEIRPGNTCNFACFTCWPEASSKIHQNYKDAGLLAADYESIKHNDFEFLRPIANRIKSVILLGGEPFYDKNCKRFLDWAKYNLASTMTIFTNGSFVDFDFIKKYSGKLKIVVSLDAIDSESEFIRNGSQWSIVCENYRKLRAIEKIELGVNITESIYNIHYLDKLVEFLLEEWPNYVAFGIAEEPENSINAVPPPFRQDIIDKFHAVIKKIMVTKIERHQKQNAVNSLKSIISRLENNDWDSKAFAKFVSFTKLMNNVKKVPSVPQFISDLCEYQC